MSRRPITNPLEYLQVARRRWLWIVVPSILIAGATAIVARKLPKIYSSDALILVEEQKVPTDFVRPTVSSNVEQRLESIEEQILSRTQLSQIIQKYGLYRGLGLTPDSEVERMLSDITVTPIFVGKGDQRTDQVSAFKISYMGPDPVLAQQVTGELSNLFIAENIKSRAQQAQGTEGFIDGQLAQASQQLQTLQAQLKQVKSANMGSLPEQEGANLQVLSQLQTVLQADSDDLARAQQQKTYLASLDEAVAGLSPSAAAGVPAMPSQAELDLRKTKSALAVAEQEYTPAYPDVIRLKAQVKALSQQVEEAKAMATPQSAAKPGSKPADKSKPTAALPPQEKGQIAVLDQEIRQRIQDQKATKAKIVTLQGRIERLPDVEEKLANLQNAYDVAKANYTKLLEEKQAAAMGAAMEQQAEGEEFRIVDPANLPQKPSSPDLMRLNLFGCVGGLMAGLGLAFLVEMRDNVARSEADVVYYSQVPILAVLPLLPKAVLALPSAGALSSPPLQTQAEGGR
ncbi:MAG TPA: Wzz/FepE/Etk N-terminal domain-containing protein [Terriglobales bacterium]|nr:Wzz/FepE/Etk N-terminal domain-containing protein [Terriglobales bacterium]